MTNQSHGNTSEEERYTRHSILRSEFVYGNGLQSPDVSEAEMYLKDTVGKLGREVRSVLDVGAGLGGWSFFMKETFGVHVTALDQSPVMCSILEERNASTKTIVDQIKCGSALDGSIMDGDAFDLIWSRDCFLYIADKLTLWRNFHRWLKPTGVIIFTDFFDGLVKDPGFEDYKQNCSYHLLPAESYVDQLGNAGFREIVTHDLSKQFSRANRLALQRLSENRQEFIRKYSEEEFDFTCDRWRSKIRFEEFGSLKYQLIIAYR
ncbi:SAM-dependent methyltransferase [Methylobacterium sp. PvP062]|uniref:SAM-dependent methyltransferase n=1 Tax=Methylobacterium radiotolerans TaxID=31998 RepID=A0ABV2NTB2_9HYPH|nr:MULTISPECIES: methyltransferase domain-containing protein [unclassified Methylobacterium]MBP2498979.1 SAM-dependent methyltransferase [Methylobacterium sp. PvP105]MBP2505521.1 SAM-dependent methyltransferase [Methylobacterium sp. PvP109]